MLERLAELMHEEWLEVMLEQGWHSVGACGHRNGIGGILRCDHAMSSPYAAPALVLKFYTPWEWG